MKLTTVFLASALLLFSGTAATAQGNSPGKAHQEKALKEEKKEKKEKKEHKEKKVKKQKKAKKAGPEADRDEVSPKPHGAHQPAKGPKGKAKATGPRKLNGVPPGHYPPPGQCRVWYPNRPPGHQPPPVDCRSLVGVKLEPGAFILHGDKAYDAEYDWREEEKRNPGTVARDIFDILFPATR